MTTKTLEQLKQEQSALADLLAKFNTEAEDLAKAIKEAEEGNPWGIFKPDNDSYIYGTLSLGGVAHKHLQVYHGTNSQDTSVAFKTSSAAERWSHAICIIMELRAQVGVVAPTREMQYTIVLTDGHTLAIDTAFSANRKVLSPCFATSADARAALNNIGSDEILKAFKTLAGIQE